MDQTISECDLRDWISMCPECVHLSLKMQVSAGLNRAVDYPTITFIDKRILQDSR